MPTTKYIRPGKKIGQFFYTYVRQSPILAYYMEEDIRYTFCSSFYLTYSLSHEAKRDSLVAVALPDTGFPYTRDRDEPDLKDRHTSA